MWSEKGVGGGGGGGGGGYLITAALRDVLSRGADMSGAEVGRGAGKTNQGVKAVRAGGNGERGEVH